MTTETKRRIKFYREALPSMKKRTFAALMLLLIAMIVAVVATYAWVTLSYAPEIARITTTLSSNGSLEIALSKPDASAPDETDIDESVPYNTDVVSSNLRWGNLINISDPSYGIDNLVLRPAQLNTASLSSSPLWGAVYGRDGRITQLNTKYTYTVWNGNEFEASRDYGVRAIASYITATSSDSAKEYDALYQQLVNAHTAVNEYYKNSVATSDNIGSLGSVMSTYLQSKLNKEGYGTSNNGNIALTTAQVTSVRNMYQSVYNAMDKEIEALLVLADLQQYIFAKEHDGMTFTPMTWDRLQSGQNKYDVSGSQHKKDPTTPDEAVSIKGLKTFITNRTYAVSDIATLNALVDKSNSGTTVYSDELDVAVNHLCAPSSALIDNESLNQWMAKDKMELASLASGSHLATLGSGVLKNYEQMAIDPDYRLPNSKSTNSNAAAIKATASVSFLGASIPISINMDGHICTNASGPSYFMDDISAIPTDINAGDKLAEDTYGMAVDFWVRTNHEGTYLVLEGATTTDTDGTILSYDGVNRVWGSTGNVALTTDSTTQGGGSCYIYYADTPEDSSRSLELLRSMKVAFVSPDGTLLATAVMDTEHPYAVNGRYTVPLIIEQRAENAFQQENEYGEEITRYGIRYLTLDQSYMITAIIYIDGATLENTQVLASTEIDGQLNLQFSSSERLNTIGDNRLLTAERYVTAEVSRNTMDFDSDDDLSTTVTAHVSGIDPSSVKAFFIRAVNSTQGSREPEMTFTKQSDGVWTADYVFDAPGTYYLRYIRMDGVDYALADPPSVTITGFALTNITWGEPGESHTVYSTETSYNESVQIQFESTDVNRMPSTVQARFIRDDGNAVSIDTRYNNATRRWEGTRTFSASGTYTLSYLVLDGNYYDASRFTKTLTLYLGMTAVVYNHNSELVTQYDTDHPETVYPKNVQAMILDNAGNALEGLTDTRLYYSLGGSTTNGVDTDLTWNESSGYYEGTLPLVRPGRYAFRSLQVATNRLSKATEAPIYVIASPDPPTYITSSESTYHDSVQFIPLQTRATIGPIRIANSASAIVSAVLYNSETAEYYPVTMGSPSAAGTIYNAGTNGNEWTINLPTYEKNDGSIDIRNGTWSVAEIAVYECFDADALYHDETNPIIWLGTSPEASAYASQNDLTPTARIAFNKLSTVVSNTVNISMTPGTTALGSASAPFMTAYQVADLGMYVLVQDNAGRTIPADKLSEVALNVSYTANTNVDAYGYEVADGANKNYPIQMRFDAENERWIPDSDSNYTWQYVGEYRVNNLTVMVNGNEQRCVPEENGVPEMYTVTSRAPSGDDMTIGTPTQTTVYGKTGETVNGAFLQPYVPSVSVPVSMTIVDADDHQYARVPDMTMKLTLTYKDGKTAPNGSYSWTGNSEYENIELPMTQDANNKYTVTSSTPLLAGHYSAAAALYWTENGQQKSRSVGTLQDIQAYSVQPTITITGVSPTGTVTVNPAGGTASTTDGLFVGTNSCGTNYAVVYMAYDVSTKPGTYNNGAETTDDSYLYADYTAPIVSFAASKIGSYDAVFTIPGNAGTSHTFTANDLTWNGAIGKITTGTDTSHTKTVTTYNSSTKEFETVTYNVSYQTESAAVVGVQKISALTSAVNGFTYTRTLTKPITIAQRSDNSGNKVSWNTVNGISWSVPGVTNGGALEQGTEVEVTVTAGEGYYNPRISEPDNAGDWTVVRETETEAEYRFVVRFGNVALSGTVSAYPKLTFSGSTYADVTVSAGGKTISSGTGVKPGTQVTVTAAAKTADGYALPRISAGTGWTKNEGNYSSAYTFTMPSTAMSVPAPTGTRMYRVQWENTTALTFTAVDSSEQNRTVETNGYVIPGHSVVITLTADGGTNPALTSPSGATLKASLDDFTKQYSFTMPAADVTLAGTADPYPSLTFGNDYAEITSLSSSGMAIATENATEKGIKPQNTVSITLRAMPGYYAPRMSQPAGVTNWTVGSETNETATYSFTMPNADVNAAARITATAAPTVTITDSNTSITVSGTNYDGSALSGTKVQPGTLVTVSAPVSSGYYNPTVTASGATLSARTGNYDSASYTFTMGTANVTLTGGATQDKQVTVNKGTGVSEATVNGTADSARVHPGRSVTITVTADSSGYYDPTASVSSGGVTLPGPTSVTPNVTYSYTFTMGESNVTLSTTAKAKRAISWTATNFATFSVSYNNSAISSGAKVIPGGTVTLTYQVKSGFMNPTVSSDDVTITNNQFTMPEKNVSITATASPGLKWTRKANEVQSFSKYGTEGDKKNFTPKAADVKIVFGTDYETVKTGTGTTITENRLTAIPAGNWVFIEVKGCYEHYTITSDDGCGGTTKDDYYYIGGGFISFTGITRDDLEIVKAPEVKKSGKSLDTSNTNKTTLTGQYLFQMPDNAVELQAIFTSNGDDLGIDFCVSGETLITLYDGSQVQIKDMDGSERVLVWNHRLGCYDTAPVSYLIDHGGQEQEQSITHLFFSDGSDLEIIGEHVFYESDTGRYVTISASNAKSYIGFGFAKEDTVSGTMKRIRLIDVKHESRVTGVYEIVSYDHMSCFTNGILTASAYIEGLLNIFDIDPDTMAYDPVKLVGDILKYGLYSYEDLHELGTEEDFRTHNAALLKVAVGKGLLTYEDLAHLMDLYRAYADKQDVDQREKNGMSGLMNELFEMFGIYFQGKMKAIQSSFEEAVNNIASVVEENMDYYSSIFSDRLHVFALPKNQ